MTREANRLIAGKQVRHLARNLFRKNKRDLVMSTREALQRCSDKILADQNQMMKSYLDHCATMIQANWRGYIIRTRLIPDIFNKMRAAEMIIGFIQGW